MSFRSCCFWGPRYPQADTRGNDLYGPRYPQADTRGNDLYGPRYPQADTRGWGGGYRGTGPIRRRQTPSAWGLPIIK